MLTDDYGCTWREEALRERWDLAGRTSLTALLKFRFTRSFDEALNAPNPYREMASAIISGRAYLTGSSPAAPDPTPRSEP